MSKALDALKNLVNREIISKYKDRNIDFYWNDESSQDYRIIKEAFEKYEELKEMYEEVCKSNRTLDKKVLELNKKAKALKSQVVGLENAYDKLADKCDRLYKALEIIKETRVDTNFIKLSKNYDDYCGMEVVKMLNHIETAEQKGITQKEYDLLKEVLL